MTVRLCLELPEDVRHVTTTRHMSRSLLEHLQVREEDIDDIEVVVGELATNATRFGDAYGYRVELEFLSDRVIITVIDRGTGFTPDEVLPPGTERPDTQGQERIGGWGLPLVEMLTDRVQFLPSEPHGTTVRAEKLLRARAETAGAAL